MNARRVAWAFEQACGNGDEKSVLVYLASIDTRRVGSFPDDDEIAAKTQIDEATVRVALKGLVDRGLILRLLDVPLEGRS